MDVGDLAIRYLDAFTNDDADATSALLAPDFDFRGPTAEIQGADAFIAATAELRAIVDSYELHRLWVDGDEACAVFTFRLKTPAGIRSTVMCEWLRADGPQLVSSRLIFDTAAFESEPDEMHAD